MSGSRNTKTQSHYGSHGQLYCVLAAGKSGSERPSGSRRAFITKKIV